MAISNAALVKAGKELLSEAQKTKIPYVKNGMTLAGMDCQGLIEYLLMQCGIPGSECELAGSNAHWRYSLKWRGTPEEAAKKFGCVPGGAPVFIVANNGGEVARGYHDDLGNAEHVGLKLDNCVIHASSSRDCVAESVFNDKTVPNGGWNQIGLFKWVNYGTKWEAEGEPDALADEDTAADAGDDLTIGDAEEIAIDEGVVADEPLTAGNPVSKQYATVVTDSGNPVKLRKSASTKEPVYWEVNCGARVLVEKKKGDWSLITAICSDGHQRRAYMMSRFLKG